MSEERFTHREWMKIEHDKRVVNGVRNALIGITVDNKDLYRLLMHEVQMVTILDVLRLFVITELDEDAPES